MSESALWSSGAALLLGAAHGINPGMGWLFAVALGLQERRTAAVWRALPPMALGHAASIAAVVMAALAVGRAVPPPVLRWGTAATLLAFGAWRLARHRHPRWAAMRVGPRDLALWSFLMATAHGAGLMVLPFVMGSGGPPQAHAAHGAAAAGLPPGSGVGMGFTVLYSAGYLLVTAAVALVVYRKLGLRILRSAWINLDLIWAVALIGTALATPFIR